MFGYLIKIRCQGEIHEISVDRFDNLIPHHNAAGELCARNLGCKDKLSRCAKLLYIHRYIEKKFREGDGQEHSAYLNHLVSLTTGQTILFLYSLFREWIVLNSYLTSRQFYVFMCACERCPSIVDHIYNAIEYTKSMDIIYT